MKLIIAGGRDLNPSPDFISEALNLLFEGYVTQVVSGGARGVDTAGELWAEQNHASVKRFPADWNTHGKAAGPIRNSQMAKHADALLLIWDGESAGSKSMKFEMLKLRKPIYEIVLRKSKV